jgi:hypothetical protein
VSSPGCCCFCSPGLLSSLCLMLYFSILSDHLHIVSTNSPCPVTPFSQLSW